MNVLCLEDSACHSLIDKVIERIKEKPYDKWVSGDETMSMLRITSKTTLQKFRDEGEIHFNQPPKTKRLRFIILVLPA